jgi:ABC-type polar amino acid transport system ATPase subunit
MSVLEVQDLEVRRGSNAILRGVSLTAQRGEILVVMGASGAGKTTVLRAVAGLDAIAAGTITLGSLRLEAGRPLRGEMRRALHRQVGMVFQFHHLFEHLTALENVCLAPVHVYRQTHADADRSARELLAHLGVAARADAYPRELSGGEAQRVAIARALAVGPPLLLMDEPTASLDPVRRGDLANTLRQLAAEGRTLVVATHDAEFARACGTRIVHIESGRVGAAG